MTQQTNLKEAERRAQSRAVAEEMKLMQQEQAAAEEKVRKSEQVRRNRDALEEGWIVGSLTKLKPLYEKRQEAFDRLATALDDFMEIEGQIMPKLISSENKIPGRSHMYPATVRQKWVQLAGQAGIPADHNRFFGGSRLARTIVHGLISGNILPGQINAGKSTLNIEV